MFLNDLPFYTLLIYLIPYAALNRIEPFSSCILFFHKLGLSILLFYALPKVDSLYSTITCSSHVTVVSLYSYILYSHQSWLPLFYYSLFSPELTPSIILLSTLARVNSLHSTTLCSHQSWLQYKSYTLHKFLTNSTFAAQLENS